MKYCPPIHGCRKGAEDLKCMRKSFGGKRLLADFFYFFFGSKVQIGQGVAFFFFVHLGTADRHSHKGAKSMHQNEGLV